MIHFRLRYETVRDTLAAQRALQRRLRGAWRATAVLAVLLLATALVARTTGRALPVWAWWGLAVVPLVTAVLSWVRDRLRDGRAASPAWLDRRLGLGELLVTAVEVDRRGPRTGPERWLLDDAATALAERANARSLRGDAVRLEAQSLAAAALIVVGAALAWGFLRGLPPVALLGPPGFGGRGATVGADPNGGGTAHSDIGQGLDDLARTWSDHAALRPAARALEDNDASAAARALRTLADRAPELSEAGARDLAQALQQAAESLGEGGGGAELGAALREAGAAMEREPAQEQSAALERLAQAIEYEAGAPSGAPGGGRGQARERDGPPASRLAVQPEDLSVPPEARQGGAVAAPRSSAAPGAGEAGDDAARVQGGGGVPGEGTLGGRNGIAGEDLDPAVRARLSPGERDITSRYFLRGRSPRPIVPLAPPSPATDRP